MNILFIKNLKIPITTIHLNRIKIKKILINVEREKSGKNLKKKKKENFN
jgi:hypothetical protein